MDDEHIVARYFRLYKNVYIDAPDKYGSIAEPRPVGLTLP